MTKATEHFLTEYEAWQTLCLNCKWSLAWWTFEEAARPLTRIQPDLVTVRPVGHPTPDLWPTPRMPGQKKKAQTRAAPESAVPVPEGQDSEEEGDDGEESGDESEGRML